MRTAVALECGYESGRKGKASPDAVGVLRGRAWAGTIRTSEYSWRRTP